MRKLKNMFPLSMCRVNDYTTSHGHNILIVQEFLIVQHTVLYFTLKQEYQISLPLYSVQRLRHVGRTGVTSQLRF